MSTEDVTVENAQSLQLDCPKCDSKISEKARVCPICQKHLGRWGAILDFVQVGGPLIAIIAVVISYYQFQDARMERVAADDAKNLAQKALVATEASVSEMRDFRAWRQQIALLKDLEEYDRKVLQLEEGACTDGFLTTKCAAAEEEIAEMAFEVLVTMDKSTGPKLLQEFTNTLLELCDQSSSIRDEVDERFERGIEVNGEVVDDPAMKEIENWAREEWRRTDELCEYLEAKE